MFLCSLNRHFLLAAAAASLLASCSAKDDTIRGTPADAGADAMSGEDSGAPLVPVCPPENPFCGPTPSEDAGMASCAGEAVDITPIGVNVMLAVDGSYAMRSHWDVVQLAVKRMVEANPTLSYGAHLFWGETGNIIDSVVDLNACQSVQNRVLAVAADQQTAVLPWLGPRPPGVGGRLDFLRTVVAPLRYYVDNETALSDPKSTNYLVFISNGNDDCFGHILASKSDKYLTYEKLASELVKRNIRIVPIGFDAASAQRSVRGTNIKTDYEALKRLAVHGGSGLTEALAADSADELEQAINKVGQMVRSCRFQIPDTLDPTKNLNPFELTFFINGTQVPRDRLGEDGWNFAGGATSEVEMFGNACQAIQAGKPLEARRSCSQEGVCGTAASKVSTKARAIQYLMDRSASMAACSDDSLLGSNCYLSGKSLTWWGRATRAVTQSVVAPVNDEVEFGMQFFPGVGLGSCDVADKPEVEVSPNSEISIISSMLKTLPVGSTPLVSGLEQVAENPGRLAEPGVTSAVILISDGGNACDGLSPQEAADKLAAAAKKLYDRGVKVYAIRFGEKGSDFADQDVQLRAIVTNGGTAIVDPANPDQVPYLEAPTEEELNAVLASVSEQLATCEFELGEVSNVDKTKTNLYINGETIPYDAEGMKQDGWGWTSEQRTGIVMYGESCKRFKSNRVSSLVVEFGCDAVVLN